MVDLVQQEELRSGIELLYFAYRGFTDQPDRMLAGRGLGRVHHRILYFIARRPDVSVGGLLEVLAVSKQALNGPLRQLIEMDLVSAESDPVDRRAKRLRLTSAGDQLESELTGAQIRLLSEAFAEAGPGAEQGWRQVMQALASAQARK